MPSRRELLNMAVGAGLFGKALWRPESHTPSRVGLINFTLQTRSNDGVAHTRIERVDPKKVGIIVVDVWDYNTCRTWRNRAASLIPRFNYCFEAARKLGMTLVFSPTNAMRDLNESPQRKATLALPNHPMPAPLKLPVPSCTLEHPQELHYGMCECGIGEPCFYTYNTNNQHPDLKMTRGDFIALFTQEVYNIFKERGVTHIIYTGFASNMCVWSKPPGMKHLRELGFRCFLARDLTEALTGYIPESFNPTRGTIEINQVYESGLAPSINLECTMRAAGAWEGEPVLNYVHIAPWGRLFGGPPFLEQPIEVELRCRFAPGAKLRYTLDGSAPTPESRLYQRPIVIHKSAVLKAAGFKGEKLVTRISEARYWKYPPVPDPPDIFISDLRPLREFVGEVKPHHYAIKRAARFNHSVVGHVLTNHGVKFSKGAGVQAPSELIFALRPEYKHFVAIAGVDDECMQWDNPNGLKQYPWQWSRPIHGPTSFRICKIVFQVEIDGKLQAETPPLFNGDKAWGIDVPIPEGSRQIALRVKDAESRTADPYGHGDWLNAGFSVLRL